jgi:SAM-dependent methyltransferase
MNTREFVNDLNNRFFNGELSEPFQDKLSQLPIDRPDVFAFVERMFSLIRSNGMPAKDLSLQHAEVLGTLLARILPGAWEGRVPPITVQGRHAVIDQYIKKNNWISSAGKSMLDIGCGFPPFTTIETSNYLSDWNITGADISMPAYLIYDSEGNYATLDENKSTVYFQPAIPSLENWNKLLSNSSATKKHFENLLDELLDHSNGEGFPRLERDPIKTYETEKLSFIKGGIGQLDITPKDVIRCFNVLYYFDDNFQQNAIKWFAENINEGGILLFGGDWAASTECYYNIYKKTGNELVNKAFAFSIDCICPFGIVTWYGLHDDDRQKAELVKYISIIRKDKGFMDAFYTFHDAQRLKYKICPRDEQGYYGVVDPSIQPQDLGLSAGKMLSELNEEGFNQKAVNILNDAGLNARVNEVGHIAIEQ